MYNKKNQSHTQTGMLKEALYIYVELPTTTLTLPYALTLTRIQISTLFWTILVWTTFIANV